MFQQRLYSSSDSSHSLSPLNRLVSAYQSLFLVKAWQFPFTESFTNYRIWLKAFTWKNEGSPSEQLSLKTDVAGPPSPLITNLTCADERCGEFRYKIALPLFQFKFSIFKEPSRGVGESTAPAQAGLLHSGVGQRGRGGPPGCRGQKHFREHP